jgi:hypothetical protein
MAKKAQAPEAVAVVEAPKAKVTATVNDDYIRFPWETNPTITESTQVEQPEDVEEAGEEPEADEVEAASEEQPQAQATDDDSQADSPEEQPEAKNDDDAEGDRLRLADYTRKTQKLSEERKQWEAERATRDAEIARQREEYGQRLATLDAALTETLGPEPNWDQLRAELTPAEFAAKWADHNLKVQKLNTVRSEQQRIRDEQQKQYNALQEAYKAEQAEKLFTVIPELRDEAKATELVRFAQNSFGFTEQEIDGALDHRLWVLIHEAKQWRDLQSKAKETSTKVKAQAVLKPGAKTGVTPISEAKKKVEAARATALRTGDMEDIEILMKLEKQLKLAQAS